METDLTQGYATGQAGEIADALRLTWVGRGVGTSTGAARVAKDDPTEFVGFEGYYAKAVAELGITGCAIVIGLQVALLLSALHTRGQLAEAAIRSYSDAIAACILLFLIYSYKGPVLHLDPADMLYWLFVGVLFSLPGAEAMDVQLAVMSQSHDWVEAPAAGPRTPQSVDGNSGTSGPGLISRKTSRREAKCTSKSVIPIRRAAKGSIINMKVNVAVCGRFHYHNYVKYLASLGILNRFYYSHRLSTDSTALGISKEQAINLWGKEYLFGIHSRLTRGRLGREIYASYADLWQAGVLRRWADCDILHLMLHGTGVALARRAKSEGSVVLIEPVNQHIEAALAIVEEEREALGLKPIGGLSRVELRQMEETAASDFLLAPSRIVRDSFVKRGYDARKTAVLHYGVDTDRFRPLEGRNELPAGRPFRVICVAQISVRKGHVYLLEAWKRLALPNSELLLIGAVSHEMEAILERYRGLFQHISGVANARLRDYYGRASVFVLPSLEDGCAIVCAEAMACGVPVITTSSNGSSEIIDHGKDGFVVPARSSEAIAECLERLYRDEELRQEMSVAALAKARRDLTREIYAFNLNKIYRMALDLHRHPDLR